MLKLGNWLWVVWGRDFRRRGREFRALFFPRRDLTAEGFMVAGLHFYFWADWVDCEVSMTLIPATRQLAA